MSDEQVTFLREQLDMNIGVYDAKGKRHQTWAFVYMLAVAVMGALTTICLGIKTTVPDPELATTLSNIALVLSAAVTVFSVGDTMLNPRALWMQYSAAEGALKAIRTELDFLSKGGSTQVADDDALQALFDRMQTVVSETTQAKMEARRAHRGGGDSKKGS